MNYLSKLFFTLLTISFVAACSSKNVKEPKELVRTFHDKIVFDREWKTNVGAGDDGLRLQLSPVLRDSKIYTVDIDGTISVIEQNTGKLTETFATGVRVGGGLALDSKRFFVTSFEGELLAFDQETGRELWRSELTSESIVSPAVNGLLVVAQTIDGKLTAFDSETGKKLWRYDSNAPLLSLRGTAKPYISQKYTFASFANGEVLMFENKTGQPKWKAVIGVPKGRTELDRLVDVDGQVVLEGDRLYVVGYQGKLAALNADDGREIWSKELSSFNSVALGFGNIYVTTSDGELLALSKVNGAEIWKNEAFMYRRLQTPIIFDQFVLSADFEGFMHVLSVIDGQQVARKQPGDEVMGEILLSGDRMYVYTQAGDLIAYHLIDSEIKDRIYKNWRSRNLKRSVEVSSSEEH